MVDNSKASSEKNLFQKMLMARYPPWFQKILEKKQEKKQEPVSTVGMAADSKKNLMQKLLIAKQKTQKILEKEQEKKQEPVSTIEMVEKKSKNELDYKKKFETIFQENLPDTFNKNIVLSPSSTIKIKHGNAATFISARQLEKWIEANPDVSIDAIYVGDRQLWRKHTEEEVKKAYREAYLATGYVPEYVREQVSFEEFSKYKPFESKIQQLAFERELGLKSKEEADIELSNVIRKQATVDWMKSYGSFSFTVHKAPSVSVWDQLASWLGLSPKKEGKIIEYKDLTWSEYLKYEPGAVLKRDREGFSIMVDPKAWFEKQMSGKSWWEKQLALQAGRFLAGFGSVEFMIKEAREGPSVTDALAYSKLYDIAKSGGSFDEFLSSSPIQNVALPLAFGGIMGKVIPYVSGVVSGRYGAWSWKALATKSAMAGVGGVMMGYTVADIQRTWETEGEEKGLFKLGQFGLNLTLLLGAYGAVSTTRSGKGFTPYEAGFRKHFPHSVDVGVEKGYSFSNVIEYGQDIKRLALERGFRVVTEKSIIGTRTRVFFDPVSSSLLKKALVAEAAVRPYVWKGRLLGQNVYDPGYARVFRGEPATQGFARGFFSKMKGKIAGYGSGTEMLKSHIPRDVDWKVRFRDLPRVVREVEYGAVRTSGRSYTDFFDIKRMPFKGEIINPMGNVQMSYYVDAYGNLQARLVQSAFAHSEVGMWLGKPAEIKHIPRAVEMYGSLLSRQGFDISVMPEYQAYSSAMSALFKNPFMMSPMDVKFYYPEGTTFSEKFVAFVNLLHKKTVGRIFGIKLDEAAFQKTLKYAPYDFSKVMPGKSYIIPGVKVPTSSLSFPPVGFVVVGSSKYVPYSEAYSGRVSSYLKKDFFVKSSSSYKSVGSSVSGLSSKLSSTFSPSSKMLYSLSSSVSKSSVSPSLSQRSSLSSSSIFSSISSRSKSSLSSRSSLSSSISSSSSLSSSSSSVSSSVSSVISMSPFSSFKDSGVSPTWGRGSIWFGLKGKEKKEAALKIVLADPFSVMVSQIKFGKATHQRPTREVWREAEKSGWRLGTVEMRKAKKFSFKSKKRFKTGKPFSLMVGSFINRRKKFGIIKKNGGMKSVFK
jgi:uncharacterized protein YneF (UPF0154 family)